MFRLYNVGVMADVTRTAKLFGANLRAIRKGLGLSQQDIADNLDVSAPTVSQWETGAYLPDHETIDRLVAFLGTTPEDMFKGVSGTQLTRAKPSLTEAIRIVNDNLGELKLSRSKLVKNS